MFRLPNTGRTDCLAEKTDQCKFDKYQYNTFIDLPDKQCNLQILLLE